MFNKDIKTYKDVVLCALDGAVLVALYSLSRSAFTPDAKGQIRERDNWTCVGCGVLLQKGTAIAGHLNHARAENYDSPENGVVHCAMCELGYHVKNHDNANETLGMSKNRNRSVIRGWYYSFEEDERRRARRLYGWRLIRLL